MTTRFQRKQRALRVLCLCPPAALLAALAAPGGCGGSPELPIHDGSSGGAFCDLPGSLVYAAGGAYIEGSVVGPDLSWLHVPDGFCVHYFGNIPNARQIRFAPGGELFVASPTTSTTGGGSGGLAAIVVLADDNGDGLADEPVHFLDGLASTQGLLFTTTDFYYQDAQMIRRLAYHKGDRVAAAPGAVAVDIEVFSSILHWPKTLDAADDGTIYVGNGGEQYDTCEPTHAFHGGILRIDGTSGGAQVAKGLRNPIGLRCQRGTNRCFATELSKDFSGGAGGREKIIPIHQGDDWGFPCCASKNVPYGDIDPTDCSGVVAEGNAFVIGDTPFGLEFEPGAWPKPWKKGAFVVLHGAYGSWSGARVVSIAVDPSTGDLAPLTDLSGESPGGVQDFATGWDDNTLTHGRPSALAMSPDGRLFVANDVDGTIVWIAPIGLRAPADAGGE